MRSASGSTYVVGARARVARAGRIYVEGKHDAELVEKVWGHDLRVEGVVVEPLHGVDDLPAIVKEFRPTQGRRLGVLVDHLVRGSKESRIAEQITGEHALVVGHPFIDIWQAVKPSVVGIPAWPVIPKGQPWKEGVCGRWAGRTTRATSGRSASSPGSRASPTWSRPCSGGWRSSSTSSRRTDPPGACAAPRRLPLYSII